MFPRILSDVSVSHVVIDAVRIHATRISVRVNCNRPCAFGLKPKYNNSIFNPDIKTCTNNSYARMTDFLIEIPFGAVEQSFWGVEDDVIGEPMA